MSLSSQLVKKHSGLALVEFSIVLPLLLLLLLSVAEFGRLFMHYNELVKTTRDAARFLAETAISGTTGYTIISSDLIQRTQNLVVYGNELGNGNTLIAGITTSDVTVTEGSAGHVRVAISYQYQPILFRAMPLFIRGDSIDLGLNLTSSCNMRVF